MIIYRTFHPIATEYTFFANIHGTFSKIDNILGQGTSFNKFENIEIIQIMFFNHNEIEL